MISLDLSKFFACIAILGVGIALSSCGDNSSNAGGASNPGIACPAIAAASVSIVPTDSQGAVLNDLLLSYRLDGGPVQQVRCTIKDYCVVAWNQLGRFDITISKENFQSVTRSVTVVAKAGDLCNMPQGQVLHVQLQPL